MWTKSILSLVLSLLFFRIAYAAGLFSLVPSVPSNNQTANGSLPSMIASNTLKTCSSGQFVKGFDRSYWLICVSYSASTANTPENTTETPSSISFPSGAPSGEILWWRFGEYLKNLFGICPGTKVLKGLASNGEKICVEPTSPNTFTSPTVSVNTSIISYPSTPDGETTDGRFQTVLSTMSTTCGNGKMVSGLQADGTPKCSPIGVNVCRTVSPEIICPPIPNPGGPVDNKSCKTILDSGGSHGDGMYTIDPDGAGGNAPFSAMCDMTRYCGGWTEVPLSSLEVFKENYDWFYNPPALWLWIWDDSSKTWSCRGGPSGINWYHHDLIAIKISGLFGPIAPYKEMRVLWIESAFPGGFWGWGFTNFRLESPFVHEAHQSDGAWNPTWSWPWSFSPSQYYNSWITTNGLQGTYNNSYIDDKTVMSCQVSWPTPGIITGITRLKDGTIIPEVNGTPYVSQQESIDFADTWVITTPLMLFAGLQCCNMTTAGYDYPRAQFQEVWIRE